jgi:hypothetical protein
MNEHLKALELLEAMNLKPNRVSKTEDSVCLAFLSLDGGLYADIEFFSDGEIIAVTSDGKDHDLWDVPLSDVQTSLTKIHNYIHTHSQLPIDDRSNSLQQAAENV